MKAMLNLLDCGSISQDICIGENASLFDGTTYVLQRRVPPRVLKECVRRRESYRSLCQMVVKKL